MTVVKEYRSNGYPELETKATKFEDTDDYNFSCKTFLLHGGKHPGTWHCTRLKGHDGPHEAGYDATESVGLWYTKS